MSLVNASIVTAPSAFAPTGGTAVAFSGNSPSQGKMSMFVSADTDLRLRRTIDVTVKTPSSSASAPNGYTQARVQYLFRYPKLLANGRVTVNTAKVEFAYDVETTQTEIQQLLDVAGQICVDADFTPTSKSLVLA